MPGPPGLGAPVLHHLDGTGGFAPGQPARPVRPDLVPDQADRVGNSASHSFPGGIAPPVGVGTCHRDAGRPLEPPGDDDRHR